MTDLSQFIAPKSDQLNADDLIGGPRTIQITNVSADPSNAEQPVLVHFLGDNGKPWKPCKSMRRVLVHCWGRDGQSYVGRRVTLWRDPKVRWGGVEVGGIRISHLSDLDGKVTMALTETQKQRRPYTVQPLAKGPDHAAAAKAAAQLGTESFRTWFRSATPDAREAVKPIIPELKALAETADAADPFGLPPLPEAKPTPEEIERAMAATAEQVRAMDREIEG
jgi:hypothetical protein